LQAAGALKQLSPVLVLCGRIGFAASMKSARMHISLDVSFAMRGLALPCRQIASRVSPLMNMPNLLFGDPRQVEAFPSFYSLEEVRVAQATLREIFPQGGLFLFEPGFDLDLAHLVVVAGEILLGGAKDR
jgi:hypothetical protein